jgi:hypothetical protein
MRKYICAALLEASKNLNLAIDWATPADIKPKASRDLRIAKAVIWRAYWAIEKKKGR